MSVNRSDACGNSKKTSFFNSVCLFFSPLVVVESDYLGRCLLYHLNCEFYITTVKQKQRHDVKSSLGSNFDRNKFDFFRPAL